MDDAEQSWFERAKGFVAGHIKEHPTLLFDAAHSGLVETAYKILDKHAVEMVAHAKKLEHALPLGVSQFLIHNAAKLAPGVLLNGASTLIEDLRDPKHDLSRTEIAEHVALNLALGTGLEVVGGLFGGPLGAVAGAFAGPLIGDLIFKHLIHPDRGEAPAVANPPEPDAPNDPGVVPDFEAAAPLIGDTRLPGSFEPVVPPPPSELPPLFGPDIVPGFSPLGVDEATPEDPMGFGFGLPRLGGPAGFLPGAVVPPLTTPDPDARRSPVFRKAARSSLEGVVPSPAEGTDAPFASPDYGTPMVPLLPPTLPLGPGPHVPETFRSGIGIPALPEPTFDQRDVLPDRGGGQGWAAPTGAADDRGTAEIVAAISQLGELLKDRPVNAYLDGRCVTDLVNGHNARWNNAPIGGTSAFDSSAGFTPTGAYRD